MSSPLYTNRLINEKSPYLLQHAHNPVDWYPWGEEAFKAAKEKGLPIFLSIGYATCHWCHVMEMESFQNPDLAHLLNETFINIKVDREEKPEVDSLYMEIAQAMMSGGAGWPLNVILTPDLQPFFAATYLPADSNHGFLGVKQLAERIAQIWQDPVERENVIAQAGKIVDIFASHIHPEGENLPTKEIIGVAAELLYKSADPIYGGAKGIPKFPVGLQCCFLLRCAKASLDSRALFYVEKSLEMMHRGGIFDHLGGGFSRYSVDEKWLVPHFEKMLYDNAILARAYLEAWEYTHNPFYKEVSEEVLNYIAREMTDPEGGFYSAEDADSEGHEGRFYTWTFQEIQSVLGEEALLFAEYYGVTPNGNFEGRSILHIPVALEEFARMHHLDPAVLKIKLGELKKKLFDVRNNRARPKKDDKVLTSWNGLMIHSFAQAAISFQNEHYLKVALQAAHFIKNKLWDGEKLLRRYRSEDARFDGCLDDYAFMISGLLSLFEADGGSEWLEFALTLANILTAEFKEPKGAFYLTNGKDPHLILRRCEFYDGAEPSGNAVHAENLIRLYQITGAEEYLIQAEDILKAAKHHLDLYPPGGCYHLMALQHFLDLESPTIVIVLDNQNSDEREIKQLVSGKFIPHKSIIWRREADEVLRDSSPLVRDKVSQKGKTTLYLCHRNRCKAPAIGLKEIENALSSL